MSDRTGAVISEQMFGETVADAYGVPFCLAADGKWYRADASDPLLSRGDMALCVEPSVAADGEGRLLKYGWIRRTGWAWTLGQPVYFGATPGTLTQTKPVGNTIRYAGYPAAADALWFSPTDPVLAEFFSLELPDGVQGDILYHSGLGWVPLNAGTAGQVLATGGPGANPAWSPASGLPPGTQGDILYHNGTAWTPLIPGAAGQVLQTGGAAADPAWADLPDGLHRNAIINGNFDIWQRGTSFTGKNIYTADRWRLQTHPASSHTVQRIIEDGHTYLRATVDQVSPYHNIGTIVENGRNLFRGQKLSLRVRLRASGDYTLGAYIARCSNYDGVSEVILNSAFAVSEGFNDYTFTTSQVPDTYNATYPNLRVCIYLQEGANVPVGGYIDLAQVQLNIGDKPLPFAPRPFGEELAICQRYYRTWTQQTENGRIYVPLWPPMRVAPTMTASAGTTSNITAAGFNLTHNAQATTTITASSEL